MDPVLKKEDDRVVGHRFRMVRLLKAGQGIETWLGIDLWSGREVIIKTACLEGIPEVVRLRLEHEARILKEIESHRMARFLALENDQKALFLVVGHVPGTTLQEALQRASLSVHETISIGISILTALQELHRGGVLHRDVKPSNIIVDREGPLEEAVLIDFGFARSEWLADSIRELPVGTIQYVSPEQAELIESRIGEPSDLYSLGVVLYECLAGRPPFQGTDAGELLRQHLNTIPAGLRTKNLAVPRALEEVIQRLLEKNPSDRYQSAEAVIADLSEISEAIDRGITEPDIVIGRHDRRRSLAEPTFVGRAKEIEVLELELGQALEGNGRLVLLEGESGIGKSRLLKEFEQIVLRQGAWILRGQGLDQAAQHPFHLLDGVVNNLIEAGRSNATLGKSITLRLEDQVDAVCAALPELRALLGSKGIEPLGLEEHGEIRNLRAMTALLDALGSRERPAVIFLDDGQWADEATLRLLDQWQRQVRGEKPGRYVLVVVAFRSEEVSGDHILRHIPVSPLKLSYFGSDEIRKLVESMAGRLPEKAMEVVLQLSEGNSFMAAAVLQGLVENGALIPGPAGWRIEPERLAEVQASRRAAIFLARRLERLSAGALRFISVGAILGKEFDLRSAGDLAGVTSQENGPAALEEAKRHHILWVKSEASRGVFVHDKIRETLLKRLPEEERKHLHLLAAQRIELADQGRLFELAYHFDAAGQPEKAVPYALAAAEKARSQHALEIAERQYLIAERGAHQADEPTRKRVVEGLGDVLMLRGRYDEAENVFRTARKLAKDKIEQAKIEGKIGELAFKRGDIKGASEAIERGLQLIGRMIPSRPWFFVPLLLWEAGIQVLHTYFPNLFLARRELVNAESDFLAIRLYSRLAYTYWFQRGTIPAIWAQLREMNLAERYPFTSELGQAYANHGVCMTLIPYFVRGVSYAEKGLLVRRTLGDLWGEGQSHHFYGITLYAASKFSEGIEKSEEAVRLLEKTGDLWETNNARAHIAYNFYRRGDLRAAVEQSQKTYRAALAIGELQAAGLSLDIWSKASGGRVPEANIRYLLQHWREDAQTFQIILQGEVTRLLGERQYNEASSILQKAKDLIKEFGLRNEYTVPVYIMISTSLRLQAEKVPVFGYSTRRLLLKSAKKAAQQGFRLARKFRNNLPHALREIGLLSAMEGKMNRARKYFDESLLVAKKQEMRFEYAQSLLARGKIGVQAGWPEAAEEVAHAEQELHALGGDWVLEEYQSGASLSHQSATLSLADRFDSLLEEGRKVASSLTEEATYRAVHQAAHRLLRGEHCIILKRVGEERFSVVAGEDKGYSRTIVHQALKAGRPVIMTEIPSDNVSDSMVLSGAKSVMAAPIFMRGEVVACFYISHHKVGRLFGEEEDRLASFITTLAGAALENAEGFGKLEGLTKTLEERVHERTSSLKAANEVLGNEIAERKRIEFQLERSQEQLRALSLKLQSVLEEERTRISREIHDEFGQTLTILKMQLSFLEKRFRGNPIPIGKWTKPMSQMIDSTIQKVRKIAAELRPVLLDDLGLQAAMEWQANEFQEQTGIVCDCRLDEKVAVNKACATAIFRIFQEALTNVTRHANATRVEVTLRAEDRCVVLKIRDDGRGITKEQRLHAKSLGLLGMQERAYACGGEFEIEGDEKKGTAITVRIPINLTEHI